MEFEIHQLQTIKLAVHIAQLVFISVAWILDIIVFRSSASVDGRLGWAFGLCFLTLPAIIFLTMTPRFPRTRKLANPYALLAIDLVFCILWLSAFAAVANWNGAGKCGSGCKVSKAVVGLGVFIWFFWIATTAMSVYGLLYYRREGYLPGASRAPHNAAMIDPDKEAFSTAPHDDEYAPVHNIDDHEIHDMESGYGGEQSQASSFPSYGGGYVSPSAHDEPTAYTSYSAAGGRTPSPGRAQFPSANYDNVRIIGEN